MRIRLEYPPEDMECDIVARHTTGKHQDMVLQGVRLAITLRQAAAVEELFYSPSIRETIAFGILLDSGADAGQAAKMVFGNVYAQWGEMEYQKVNDIITSMFG